MAKGERIKVSTVFSRTLMTVATYHLALYFLKYSGNGIWTMMLGFKNSYVMQNVRDDYRINTGNKPYSFKNETSHIKLFPSENKSRGQL